MTNQEDLQKLNREVAEWLGMCWHESELTALGCPTNNPIFFPCYKCGSRDDNPNFILHPEELLRGLAKREDWERFIIYIEGDCLGDYQDPMYNPRRYKIDTYYVTNQTGILLRNVGEYPGFKEWREKR